MTAFQPRVKPGFARPNHVVLVDDHRRERPGDLHAARDLADLLFRVSARVRRVERDIADGNAPIARSYSAAEIDERRRIYRESVPCR